MSVDSDLSRLQLIMHVSTWEAGLAVVEQGMTGEWRWPTSKMVYVELYRLLTHGYGLSPDDALQVLTTAYRAAKSDT
jgi:hypothetical protein